MQKEEELHRYDDIIHLPRHVSAVHPPMPVSDRAAQFAPFAALTGYGDAVRETARLTEEQAELCEEETEALDRALKSILQRGTDSVSVTVTYFAADQKKAGGAYRSYTGTLKKPDTHRGMLVFADGTEVPLSDVLSLEEAKREQPEFAGAVRRKL